jgi:hypothetical protein
MYDRTAHKGRVFDRERRRRLGAGAVLVFLRLTERDEDEAGTYESLLEPTNGWLPERVTGRDGAIYTRVQIADVSGDVATMMSAEPNSKPTHFAVSTQVFKIEPDKTVFPLGAPRVYEFRAYNQTGDTYG